MPSSLKTSEMDSLPAISNSMSVMNLGSTKGSMPKALTIPETLLVVYESVDT